MPGGDASSTGATIALIFASQCCGAIGLATFRICGVGGLNVAAGG
jgi:hypothetical protein